ncbi:MAG: HAMP domain-containing histidine kinase [Chthonomonadaceae bacterium]|nr:HAMP domain-containing histidine kinase [Chthonomonadaceae bacterium]
MQELMVGWTFLTGVEHALRDDTLSDREARELLRDCAALGQQGWALAHAVIDTLRLEAGQRVDRELSQLEMGPWLEGIVDQMGRSTSRHTFETVLHDSSRAVEMDATRVAAVLIILMTNALKFSPSGRIGIEVRGRDGWKEFEVSDEGPGIPPDEADKIFDKGFRGAACSDLYGSGMGLYVASRVTREVLGGELRLMDSPTGARFGLRVPVSVTLEGGRGA